MARLPLFPLPEVVLLPGVRVPLNVFEPRYVQLVDDLRQGDGRLVIPRLRPGERTASGEPAFDPMAGAGTIVTCRDRPGGRFYIEVEGDGRVVLEEVETAAPYRQAMARAAPEDTSWLDGPDGEGEARRFQELLRRSGVDSEGDPAVPRNRVILLNDAAAKLLPSGRERQDYLEIDDYRMKLELLMSQLRIMRNTARAIARLGPPADPSRN